MRKREKLRNPTITKEEVFDFLKKNKDFFYEKYGVTRIGVFGSILRETNFRDIDILIDMTQEKKNIHNYLALKRYLQRVFRKKIDLCLINSLKPLLRDKIEKEVIYV